MFNSCDYALRPFSNQPSTEQPYSIDSSSQGIPDPQIPMTKSIVEAISVLPLVLVACAWTLQLACRLAGANLGVRFREASKFTVLALVISGMCAALQGLIKGLIPASSRPVHPLDPLWSTAVPWIFIAALLYSGRIRSVTGEPLRLTRAFIVSVLQLAVAILIGNAVTMVVRSLWP